MSKASKNRQKDRRAKEKRSRKAAQQAKYESFKNSGTNSKRARIKASSKKECKGHSHLDGRCGNIGCMKCNPADYNSPSRCRIGNCLYSKRFTRHVDVI